VSQPEEDFAAMFEVSVGAKRFDRGQIVDGTIVAIGDEVALVSVGGKSEAQINVAELKDADGNLEVAVDDVIQAIVVSTSSGLTLSRRGVRNAATQREIEDAFQDDIAIEGKVERTIKGGYEVRIARERAFCPLSQIDIARTDDPAVHEGEVYSFCVIEYKEGGRNIVVSRRKQLEAEQRVVAAEIRKSIVAGAVLTGRVVSVPKFGAFVDLGGGIQGLLHVSEMSWSRVSSPGAVVAVGDQITVQVLRVDADADRISLGLKQLQVDPWTGVTSSYEVGQVRTGRVTRVVEFGAFVELEPGIEALAHSSTFAPTGRSGGWAESITVGADAAFEILNIDPEKKRMGVALVEEGSTHAEGAQTPQGGIEPGSILTGKVERHEQFGIFVFLAPGKTGLVPIAETGVDRDQDMLKAFPLGSEVEVMILEVDPAGRRIRLSKKAVADQRDKAELREYADRQDADTPASFGSLADKLRGALGDH
jgi:small subunit ribosomal protein S1